MRKLLLATGNPGKIREFKTLLKGLSYELTTPQQVGIDVILEETGSSLEENAALKATTYSRLSGLLTLADDSGLEVDALGGEPGVRSARYAGESASDAERLAFLLHKLKDVPWELRTARFRCVIAIANAQGVIRQVEGHVEGMIAMEPHGSLGFGYDPIFFLPERNKTLAELPPEEKNRISHRAQAARQAVKVLRNLAAGYKV